MVKHIEAERMLIVRAGWSGKWEVVAVQLGIKLQLYEIRPAA